MTSAFAAQLGQIAATSTNELDLKARKAAHSESLIFERKIAGSQDFETIYQICLEGFQDLCQLDQRFLDFQRNVFNAQSKDQDRTQMTTQENQALDSVLEHFLSLVGSRLLLRPAVKALEWLIRRFKVQTYNTSYLISTFLPYHDTPIFQNLLSILPADLPVQYKFLGPYLKTATNPPRHAIAYSATSSDPFFTTLCSYALNTCRQDSSYPLLLAFWASIATEAVAGRLALSQSGRREVQQQRQEDVLLKVLPVLSEGLSLQDVPEMILACYTISVILANKVDLSEEVIDSLMEAIALSLSTRDLHSGIVCLSILAGRKASGIASKKLLGSLMQRPDLNENLCSVDQTYSVSGLVQALARRAIQGLKKKTYVPRLQFVASVAATTLWLPEHVAIFVPEILQAITSMSDKDAVTISIRARLIDLLQRLCETENFSEPLGRSASQLGMSHADFESLLGQVLAGPESLPQLYDVDEMEIDEVPESKDKLEALFMHLPERTVNEHSFLTSSDAPLFGLLSQAYQASCKERDGGAKFRALPVWRTGSQEGPELYVTFLLRIISGSYSEVCRATALRLVTREIEEQDLSLDSQALLAYVVPRLADPAQSIRRAASDAIIAMQGKAPQAVLADNDCPRWGAEELYDAEQMEHVRWLPASDLPIILKDGFLPTLEECVADRAHISQVMREIFLGSSAQSRAGKQGMSTSKDLRKSHRHGLFECLLSHFIATPLLAVKVDIITLLEGVEKVGSTLKFKALKPAVQQWAALTDEEAKNSTTREQLEVSYVDEGLVNLVASSDKDAASSLLDLVVDTELILRHSFLNSIFDHLVSIWPNMTLDAQGAGAQKLIDLSLSQSTISDRARDSLSVLQLPAEALARLLHAACGTVSDDNNTTPSRKRRRSSSVIKQSTSVVDSMTSHMTLALELIDSSEPEQHPGLLPGLFEALSMLQNLKRQSRTESPYLLNLCLSSMLAILIRLGPSSNMKNDLSTARIEFVTDCIRRKDSPQVQNTAILLSAELARVIPEKILHNAMPIFTYLGGHALTKDDDYSVYAVNQAIDHIIPPLIQTLQAQRKDVSGAISGLLSSFSAAFEDIAPHRRLGLFQRIISKLGTDGILNTLVAMLMVRNANSASVGLFVTRFMSGFPVNMQLRALDDLLNQALQIGQGDSDVAKTLMAADMVDNESITATLQTMIATAERILQATNVEVGLKTSGEATAEIEAKILSSLRLLMQLARATTQNETISSAVEHCTEALLDLVPLAEFLNLNAHILRSEDASWYQDALMLLEARLSTASTKEAKSRKAALSMLPTLTDLISENSHDRVMHGAIRCIDRITELYGRRDTAVIVKAASVLSTSLAITPEKPSLQTVTLFCLASMLDCVKEAIIPIVPKVMSMSLAVLKNSLTEDAEDERLHDAAYALISAIITNVSFMISDIDLDKIMTLSAESVNAGLGQQSQDNRRNALALLARKVDIKHIVSSHQRTWSSAIENDVAAASQALDMLSNSIKCATKASVVALADQTSGFFTQMLDLRRVQFTQRDEDSYAEEEVSAVEEKVNKVAIEFIYKLNDTIFRPLLVQWLDWAVNCTDVPPAQLQSAKTHRQISIFRFLAYFFGTLKSIVTSYATHALGPAVEVLQLTAALSSSSSTKQLSLDLDQQLLLSTTLDMIAEACRYDQDSFFASPSHFPSLAEPLIAQLTLAADKTLQSLVQAHVLPAIVALAFATADTVEHHKELNHHICQLRHSEAAGVRMAGIQAQHALVASEDVGQEWVDNVVQGGGETMVYINEMLEDDDEDVEREVRRWVRVVREMTGEDLFEA
jgi:U3 small nucleolar RNA-associated protein 10